MNNMVTSIIAENITDYLGRHTTRENNKQGFQQDLIVYP